MRRFAANYIFPITGKPIKNGYVEIDENGTVIKTGTLTEELENTEFYNGIICPGFVNAHCHVELSHLAGAFKEATGMSGFINQINALRLTVDKESRLKALKEQMYKMYKDGVNGMGDISNCDESFEAKANSPIITHTYLEQFGCIKEEKDEIMKNAYTLQDIADSYKIQASITPHSCYTMSAELLESCIKAGLEREYISYHSQESTEEEDLIRTGTGNLAENYKGRNLPTPKVTGKSSLNYFITRAKNAVTNKDKISGRILLVHNVATDAESIDEALSTFSSVYWAICPLSNIFIHRQLPPLDLMIEKALDICVGTDSLSSNHQLSMIEEIKCICNNFPHIEFEEIMKWCTINGAKAIGADAILGSFDTGKKPGIVLIENFDLQNLKPTKKTTSRRLV